ncbi:hypothetical protein LCGC14_3068920, partial [marine sediment metagenome]
MLVESNSEDFILKFGYYKIQIKTVKESKEIYPSFNEIISSLNIVQKYFGEDYEDVIFQVLKETNLSSCRSTISYEPLEIISI